MSSESERIIRWRKKNDLVCLGTFVPRRTKERLTALAKLEGVTQWEMLNRLMATYKSPHAPALLSETTSDDEFIVIKKGQS
jgi:hypothetical protein